MMHAENIPSELPASLRTRATRVLYVVAAIQYFPFGFREPAATRSRPVEQVPRTRCQRNHRRVSGGPAEAASGRRCAGSRYGCTLSPGRHRYQTAAAEKRWAQETSEQSLLLWKRPTRRTSRPSLMNPGKKKKISVAEKKGGARQLCQSVMKITFNN